MVSRVLATLGDLGEVAAILVVGKIIRFPFTNLTFKRSQLSNRLTESSILKA